MAKNKILRIELCKLCNRRGELIERVGGWTVSCEYSNPINCASDNKSLCKWEYCGELFPAPDAAIVYWNKKQNE